MGLRGVLEFLTLVIASAIAVGCGDSGGVPVVSPNEPGITTTEPALEMPEPTTPAPTTTTVERPPTNEAGPPQEPDPAPSVAQLRPNVLNTYPHDTGAFTQGLVWNGTDLLESTGRRGQSSLRRVDLTSGEVTQRADVSSSLFAEGLEQVGDRLVQLTWQANTALVYDATSFELTGTFDYPTEGWGLCLDNQNRFVMSDGTSTLYFRNPETFAETGSVTVTLAGNPLARLNELECVNGEVYANVWLTNTIVRINPETGEVVAEIDAAGLLTPGEAESADVLNGIAYRAETDTFLITGKNWPKLFEVTFG